MREGWDGTEKIRGKAELRYSETGAYAEYIAVSTHMLIHKPPELSWEQAAGIPEVSTPFHLPRSIRFSPSPS